MYQWEELPVLHYAYHHAIGVYFSTKWTLRDQDGVLITDKIKQTNLSTLTTKSYFVTGKEKMCCLCHNNVVHAPDVWL